MSVHENECSIRICLCANTNTTGEKFFFSARQIHLERIKKITYENGSRLIVSNTGILHEKKKIKGAQC